MSKAKAVGEPRFVTLANGGDAAKRKRDENLPRFSVILTGKEWMATSKQKLELGQNKIGSWVSMRCVRVSDVLAKEHGRWWDSEEKAGLGQGMRGTGMSQVPDT